MEAAAAGARFWLSWTMLAILAASTVVGVLAYRANEEPPHFCSERMGSRVHAHGIIRAVRALAETQRELQ
jgi:hypothetical protein